MNCFLTGWASPFPNSLDTTKLVAEYGTMENILKNAETIFPQNIETLSAWSMGAIIALGILGKVSGVKRVVLISPTLKFCCNDEMTAELKLLKRNIAKNKEAALKPFAKICGVPDEKIESEPCIYSTEELLAGLDFLEKTEISCKDTACLVRDKNAPKISIICGENDKIIPLKSSLEVAEKLGVSPIIVPNGSHFDAFDYFLFLQNQNEYPIEKCITPVIPVRW